MSKTLQIVIFVIVLAVAGALGYYVYQKKSAADALAKVPTNPIEADDDATYRKMVAIFKTADTSQQWGWMQEFVGKKYTGALPAGLPIAGKPTKVGAFTSAFYEYFYDFAAGGKKAAEVNGGAGYPVGGGYSQATLNDALYRLFIDFKTRQESGLPTL